MGWKSPCGIDSWPLHVHLSLSEEEEEELRPPEGRSE